MQDAVREVDIVVVTIPQKHVADFPEDLFTDMPAQTIVIDTGNYYPRQRDGRIEPTEAGTLESRWLSSSLADRW